MNPEWSALCSGVHDTTGVDCARRDTCARYVYKMLLDSTGCQLEMAELEMPSMRDSLGIECMYHVEQHLPPVWWDNVQYPAP